MRPRAPAKLIVLAMLLAVPALAQFGGESVGHLYGKVVDEQGAVLPGVTVTLSGVGAPAITTTNNSVEFRFLNVAPGTYTLKLELSSFATVMRENVVVKLGKNTEITETLKLASVAATVVSPRDRPSSSIATIVWEALCVFAPRVTMSLLLPSSGSRGTGRWTALS